MKALKIILLAVLTSLLLVSCSKSGKTKSDTSTADTDSVVGTKAPALISEDDASSEEIADGEGPKAIYYKKLYTGFCIDTVYDGSVRELDYSLLDGYSFVGLLASTFESYEDENSSWVMPDTELTSNYFGEGCALLYNEKSDDFLVWSQYSNWSVVITRFPADNY